MTISQLIQNKVDTLPPEKQQEVLDFVEFLQSRVKSQDLATSLLAEGNTLPLPEQLDAEEVSALTAAQKWAGCVEGGPNDLSTNPDYMQGYGG